MLVHAGKLMRRRRERRDRPGSAQAEGTVSLLCGSDWLALMRKEVTVKQQYHGLDRGDE